MANIYVFERCFSTQVVCRATKPSSLLIIKDKLGSYCLCVFGSAAPHNIQMIQIAGALFSFCALMFPGVSFLFQFFLFFCCVVAVVKPT